MKKPNLDQYDENDFKERWEAHKIGLPELSEIIENIYEGRMNKLKKKQYNELASLYNKQANFHAFKLVK